MTTAPQASRTITVGRLSIPHDNAVDWLRDYTDAARNTAATTRKPYAYPAYDCYNSVADDPDRISDSDLLAPVLLNDRLTIRAFYGLQRVRPRLEEALRNVDTDLRLEEPALTEDAISSLVKPLYECLDDPAAHPHGVQTTTLSKILHRKRPRFLALHDRWVRACYWGADDDAPVKRDKTRPPSGYMAAITWAIAADLHDQQHLLRQLLEEVSEARQLTPVRVLDILAWNSRGKPVAED